ncbi:DUF1206 domain-containing protein [Phycicoccus flavus]|uniref:DUF1206 domain-containing protein n=1 Tax=Phycicoccus flavus TaxID=2502783 RepID=UPI000FEC0CB8|nr:DUF1206 domain-containing protein [Phycicoccus flavus]NHA68570.1 DUF1206 domain-containing protein [Phycicoccus flavus]
MDKSAEARNATEEANESPAVEWGARIGYGVLGGLHLLIAYIALNVAWGISGGSKQADQNGALKSLSNNTGGQILLWIGVVGFVLLGVWNITEGIITSSKEAKDRAKLVAKGVMYGFFAYTTFKVAALGGTKGGDQQTQDFTQKLMGGPGGPVLVGILGLVILGVAAYHVYKGWKKKFLEDLEEHPGEWAVHAGQYGYIAKGVAIGIVGLFFMTAAFTSNSNEVKGLDGALKSLKDMTGGPVILTLVALGFAAYGVYSFARARYVRL